MNGRNYLKPLIRSKIRLFVGKNYYVHKRYLKWTFGGIKFANKVQGILPCVQFTHKTLMLRKLKDVEMYLQYNKIINLSIAVKRINQVVINPGETFSYWKLIGKTTKSKGYKDGLILFCGSFKAGVGGGLCQLSNLIYWMTIHTPLTVIERYRHSFDVFPDSNRTQPFGSGATCVYNYRDLMIRNDTGVPYQLCVKVEGEYLVGEWRSIYEPQITYQVYEKDHRIELEQWGGYTRHNKLYREVFDDTGSKINDEYITENHAIMMYSPFLRS